MPNKDPHKPKVYTVSELTRKIKSILEVEFGEVHVEGEISNFRAAQSGHCYFALKDESAVISCAMWRPNVIRLRFKPKDGQKVEVRGYVSVFEARGQYQIIVEEMKEAGVDLLACKACSDSYGVSEGLEKLRVEVKYMGEPFTQILKDEHQRVITF